MQVTLPVKKRYEKPTAYIGILGRNSIVIIEAEGCNEHMVKNVLFDSVENLREVEEEYIICNKQELHELESCIQQED